jgi:hypothetical protein
MSATEKLRALAVAPLWVACAATWSATSAVLLTWSAVQERRPR